MQNGGWRQLVEKVEEEQHHKQVQVSQVREETFKENNITNRYKSAR